jgi:hypothetical protein
LADQKIGGIHVEASLDAGKFIEGARKLQAESKKTEGVVKSSFGAMGGAIKGFGGALAAGLSIGLLAGVAKKALDFAAAIGVAAKQLGVTTKELQLFRYAADQVGIKNAEADKGLERLGVTLGKAAAGSTAATKALASVGITLEDIRTKTRTEIFGKIADGMQRQGGAAKNAAAANLIFGESASKLTPLLDRGSKGINQLSEAAERLGIVLSDQQIQRADETAQKLDDVRAVLSAQIAGVVADNAASIITLANALGALASAIVNFLGSNPTAALGLLGALAGSRFGPIGAAAGGLAGSIAGSQMDVPVNPATNASRKLLEHNLKIARQRGDTAAVARLSARLGRGGSSAATPAIPQFLAPKGRTPRSRRARTSQGPRDRSEDVAFQFAQEQMRADMDVLRAKQSLARDYVERTSLAIQMLDLEKQQYEAELADKVRRAQRDFAEGKITKATLDQVTAQADVLRAKNDEADTLKRRALIEEEELKRMEESARLHSVDLDLQQQSLQAQLDLATTAAERREIELRLLDIARQREQQAIDELAASKDWADQEEARRRQVALNASYGSDRERVMRSTRGPLEEWAASIPQTAAEITEAFQRIEVQGLDGLSSAIADVITGTKSLKDAFGELAKSIIADIIQMTVKMLVFRAISGIMGSAFGGGGSGQVWDENLSGLYPGIDLGLPGFASGGSLRILGRTGTDRNVISVNNVPVARANYGERMTFDNDNAGSPQRLIVELRDKMLEARIAEGANVQIIRSYPGIEAGVRRSIGERNRRG